MDVVNSQHLIAKRNSEAHSMFIIWLCYYYYYNYYYCYLYSQMVFKEAREVNRVYETNVGRRLNAYGWKESVKE